MFFFLRIKTWMPATRLRQGFAGLEVAVRRSFSAKAHNRGHDDLI